MSLKKRPLEREDVWMLPKEQSAQILHDAFLKNWNYEKENKTKPSLLDIGKTYLSRFLLAGFFKIFNDASQFVGPLFIGLLFNLFQARALKTFHSTWDMCILFVSLEAS